MKKTYTKKQIQEAIKYWRNKLKKINEAELPVNNGTHTYYVAVSQRFTNFMMITADTEEMARDIAQGIIDGTQYDTVDDVIEKNNWSPAEKITIDSVELDD